MNLPRARRDDLLSTELDDEVVVYDPARKHVHSLNRTAVAIWRHCNGLTTVADIAQVASAELGMQLDQASVWLALRQLERAHLLAEGLVGAHESGLTRREILRKGGKAGVAVATPLIISALVPAAAAAQSAPRCAGAFVCGGTAPTCPDCAGGTGVCASTREGGVICIPSAAITNACNLLDSCTSSSACGTGLFCVDICCAGGGAPPGRCVPAC